MEEEKPQEAEQEKGASVKKVKLCEHPQFAKYFNMLKKGVPLAGVRHAMMRDGVDSSVLDKDPNEEVEIEEEKGGAASVKKVKLCEHPKYFKYFNMLKKGLPEASVRHAMMRDGVDTSVLDKDPNEEVKLEEEKPESAVKRVKLCEHPKYSKYFNMLKKGLPETSVRHAMMRDGVDASVLEKDPNEEIEIEEEKPAASVKKVKLCEHPKYSKYFNMLKKGLPETSVRHAMMRDGVDTSVLEKDPNEEVEMEEEKPAASTVKKVKLCEHPKYSKYFNMLKKGLPETSVRHAMMRDGIDASVLDKDPNEEIEIEEEKPASAAVKKVKLCEHPKFSKYFNMLKKGLPETSVRHAMMRDGVDTSVLEKDPNEEVELEEEKGGSSTVKKVKLCEHPKFSKYFNMLKKGLPETSVRHAMMRDGVDTSVLEKDPNEEVEIEEEKPESAVKKVKLCEHPKYSKYFNMLKKGLPETSVRHAMMRDGIDASVLDKDPNEEVEVEEEKPASAAVKKVKLSEHPKYSKYFNMLKKGLPETSVRHAMMRDGVDASVLDKDPNEEVELEEEKPAASTVKKVKLCEHPKYSKYFNMLKKGLPETSVRHAMMRDGIDSSILEKDPNEEVELEEEKPASSAVKKVKLCEHPKYSKYFNMLKKGLPEASVRHAMMRDKIDTSVLDKDPNEEVELEEGKPAATVKKVKLCEHPKYSKYFNMLKKGLPEASVRHAMMRDKVDTSVLDKDPNEEVELEEEKPQEPAKKVKLCEHPKYSKYFNMLKKGLPEASVRHAMMRDKVDTSVLDKDPNEEVPLEEEKPAKSAPAQEEDISEFKPERVMRKIPICQHPDYEQYFTLLDRQVPRAEVEYNMRKANKDVKVLDMDRNTLVEIEVRRPSSS